MDKGIAGKVPKRGRRPGPVSITLRALDLVVVEVPFARGAELVIRGSLACAMYFAQNDVSPSGDALSTSTFMGKMRLPSACSFNLFALMCCPLLAAIF